jgi:hypothetical protein
MKFLPSKTNKCLLFWEISLVTNLLKKINPFEEEIGVMDANAMEVIHMNFHL